MIKNRSKPVGIVAALALAALPSVATAGSDTPTLQDRLDRLAEQLEESRQKYHIPGMAIAVVKDDQVILCRGFGLADVANGVAATDETLFAVGSTTKAFTATLVAMLADDGAMGWDDPVRTHLPEFKLTDPEADENVTIRDLLCHRIGLASMNLLWYGTEAGRQDILETAVQAELLYPFRKKFNYSNISYLAAGMAAGRAAGTDWDTLLARRIFAPLEMTGSNTSYDVAQADSRMAKGYKWEKEKGELTHQPMRNADTVGPAGSINSSARDMARWVRFQLGRGVYDGRKLLSPEQHEQTWTKHINIQGDVDYGLGWMLREWKGRRVIEHAGGIDGFTAEVAMVPEENLGYVLLMNLFASPLQDGSREIVFNTLLEDWADDEAPTPQEDFKPYLGTYIGNFGQFKDAEFKVLVESGNLAVDVPGQTIYELNPPDEEGKRQFAITDQVKVRFNRNDRGEVYSFHFYQAGYAFEVPREGAEMPVEIDLDAARRYLGKYRSDKLNADIEVRICNNRLAVDVPGQMAYALYPPDDEGRWVFRIKDSLWVRFNDGESGDVVSLTMSEEGQESELPKVDAGEPVVLPTAAEVMAMVHKACGADRLPSIRNWRATGTVRFVHVGLSGRITSVMQREGRYRDEIDLGKFGFIRIAVDKDCARFDSPAHSDDNLCGEYLEQLQLQHPHVWLEDWGDTYTEIYVKEQRDLEGQNVYVVSLKPKLGLTTTLMVSVETGLPIAWETQPVSLTGMRVPTTYRYSDYRDVGGIMVPYHVESENPFTGRMVVEQESIVPNVEIDQRAHGSNPRSPGPCCPKRQSPVLKVIKALARAAL
jgi:CubicO group peptidase (beta-lactamase class C family)